MKEDNNLKIKRVLAQDQVYERLVDMILENTWEMGEKLPSEKELSDLFGVNKLTVRLAIQKLNTLGVTETRSGDGTFVIDFNMSKYIEQVSDFILNNRIINDVREYRSIIEIECFRLAIEKATDKEIEELRILAEDYIDYALELKDSNISVNDEKLNELAKLDVDFHRKICEISHNALLLYSFEVAKLPIFQYIKAIITKRFNENGQIIIPIEDKTQDYHYKVYEFIKERDFENGRKVYMDMIDSRL